MSKKVLFDCDTGGDDACAVALAVASPELEVLGITTCMGNQPIENTTQNTLELVRYLKTDIPVARGSQNPLVRQRWVGNPEGHRLPIPDLSEEVGPLQEKSAVEFMVDVLRSSEEKVTLIPLAPLTNIAKLMLQHPDLVREKVEEIVLMGGGMYFGNTTGAAELNFYADPEAAQAVFSFGLPEAMCGLDVCTNAYITPADNDSWKGFDNPCAKAFYSITHHSLNDGWGEFPGERTLIFDTVPVIYLLKPELFTTVKADIQIECASDLCDGMSVCDARTGLHQTDRPHIHTVVLDVDRQGYVDAVRELLKNA